MSSRSFGSLMLVAAAMVLAGCNASSNSGASRQAQQSYLAQIHQQIPDIGSYRGDTGLIRLGSAVCTMFSAGSNLQEVAGEIAQTSSMSSTDLGSLITAAAENLCPRYAGRVS